MEKRSFGKSSDGREFDIYTISNKNGMKAELTDLGAILVSLFVKDKDGNLVDVNLGMEDPDGYLKDGMHLGAVIGRNSNRVNKAKCTIAGKEYALEVNDNDNNLHSGPELYRLRKWDVKEAGDSSVTFSLFSPDGDQGYPGNMNVEVTYTITDENELCLHYTAKSDADTVCNFTNHSYFNLNGHDAGSIEDHLVQILAENYTPVIDSKAIPTGEIAPVEGTPMDFRTPKTIRSANESGFEQIDFTGGIDHNFVLTKEKGEMKKAAVVTSKESGITMTVYTDLPGIQCYVGNAMAKVTGKGGAKYDKRNGFCLETQYYPDSVNQSAFASPILKAGEVYDTTTKYCF